MVWIVNVPRRCKCWRLAPQLMCYWEVGEPWGLAGGSGSLGKLSDSPLSLCFLATTQGEISSPTFPQFPHDVLFQEKWSQVTMDWLKALKLWGKINLSSLGKKKNLYYLWITKFYLFNIFNSHYHWWLHKYQDISCFQFPFFFSVTQDTVDHFQLIFFPTFGTVASMFVLQFILHSVNILMFFLAPALSS